MGFIHLRCGSFHAALDTDALARMPRANFRKLLKLARTESRNAAVLQELGKFLKENAENANAAHTKTKTDFAVGWRYVDKHVRSRTASEVRRENNRLQNAVKRTKAELNSAESLLKIFNEMEID